ncbi:hypothetical protein [Cellulomonas aerilata]|uniref:Uncharacterized protein n=1 Tax=Cellulomonas aerilata TaxID=515326 RepID=A0A512DEP0_9CELL|nr:hypothetical protein [Cellulomonas aerilata]GEO34939.1 hypothetical protein CAE01nite_26640 [Cellulomonas aerilata]
MRTTRKTTSAAVAAVALAATILTGGPASASGHTILRDGFEGNLVPGPTIAGVPSAGRPWILDDSSRVRVREDGRITVNIRGLIFANGDPNPVPFVAASLVCGGAVVDSTEPFDLSVPKGNGHTSQRISVPDDCDDPVVLIRNASGDALGGYFAFTG